MDDTTRRAAAIEAELYAWAGESTEVFRSGAFHGVAVGLAVSAPQLAERDLVTLGLLGIWVCAFDDLIDHGALTLDDVAAQVALHERLATGQDATAPATDPIARTFAAALERLWAGPLGPALRPLLASQLVAACEAMRWERVAVDAVRRGDDVSIDTYLRHGSNSICVAVLSTAAAMLLGETACVRHVPALLEAQRAAAAAVRIANDVATWSREREEHTSANVLAFAGERATESLRDRTERELAHLRTVLDRLAFDIPATAGFLDRLTAFFLRVYGRARDLDDVTRPR